MPLYITEYGGYAAGRPISPIPTEPAIQTQVIGFGSSVSTAFLSSATHVVRMFCSTTDVGIGAYVLFSGSSVSTTAATSTNAQRLPYNVPELKNVIPASRFTAFST